MFHRYPNGDEVAIVSVVYMTNGARCERVVRNDDESAMLRCFWRDESKQVPLSTPNQPIVRQFLLTSP
jgi:hypothetical protein